MSGTSKHRQWKDDLAERCAHPEGEELKKAAAALFRIIGDINVTELEHRSGISRHTVTNVLSAKRESTATTHAALRAALIDLFPENRNIGVVFDRFCAAVKRFHKDAMGYDVRHICIIQDSPEGAIFRDAAEALIGLLEENDMKPSAVQKSVSMGLNTFRNFVYGKNCPHPTVYATMKADMAKALPDTNVSELMDTMYHALRRIKQKQNGWGLG